MQNKNIFTSGLLDPAVSQSQKKFKHFKCEKKDNCI